jgi:hypothetical protein
MVLLEDLHGLYFRIGHDNSGVFRAAWFLDKVIIDAPSLGCSWTFPCSKWLADNKDDCQLERELFPQDLETVEYNPCKSSRRTIQSDYSPHLFFSTISLLHMANSEINIYIYNK